MKKFTINCDFGGQIAPFTIFIGNPKEGNHPLDHQAKWLSDNKGGTVPAEVMDALSKLQELSKKNNVSLEDLCVYALGDDQSEAQDTNQNQDGNQEAPEDYDSDSDYNDSQDNKEDYAEDDSDNNTDYPDDQSEYEDASDDNLDNYDDQEMIEEEPKKDKKTSKKKSKEKKSDDE